MTSKSIGDVLADVLRPQRLPNKLPFDAVVVGVPDGDTVQIMRVTGRREPTPEDPSTVWVGGVPEYIRLAGIDAPEHRERPGPALDSQRSLERVCLHQQVTVLPIRIWRDPYNRIIARVRTHSGTDVNQHQVDTGHAVRL